MCMKNSDLEKKAKRYLELKKMIEDLSSEQDELKESMIRELRNRGKESVKVGSYTVSSKETTRQSVDSQSLKKNMPKVYEMYLRQSVYPRFSVKS